MAKLSEQVKLLEDQLDQLGDLTQKVAQLKRQSEDLDDLCQSKQHQAAQLGAELKAAREEHDIGMAAIKAEKESIINGLNGRIEEREKVLASVDGNIKDSLTRAHSIYEAEIKDKVKQLEEIQMEVSEKTKLLERLDSKIRKAKLEVASL